MAFRFRRSSRLGPLRLHFSQNGLSSISLGGRGASLNIPVNRSGGARTTVGLPGTGLSWSWEQGGDAAGLPNSRRLRPGQLESFKQALLELLHQQLFSSGTPGERLWQDRAVSHLLADPNLGAGQRTLLSTIEIPLALESYLLQAQSQNEAKRRARRCVAAVQAAVQATTGVARQRGWTPSEA
jgi:hypothetical protein